MKKSFKPNYEVGLPWESDDYDESIRLQHVAMHRLGVARMHFDRVGWDGGIYQDKRPEGCKTNWNVWAVQCSEDVLAILILRFNPTVQRLSNGNNL